MGFNGVVDFLVVLIFVVVLGVALVVVLAVALVVVLAVALVIVRLATVTTGKPSAEFI
jgi:hypothetical protein